MIDTSKQEMLNPNKGYKKIVQKLKSRYRFEINKGTIAFRSLQDTDLLILGGPRQPFTAQELQDIRNYVENGGSVFIIMNEGGE